MVSHIREFQTKLESTIKIVLDVTIFQICLKRWDQDFFLTNPFMYQNSNYPMNSILGPYCGFNPNMGGNHMFEGNSRFLMIN